jgi:hypothetical protein
MSFLCLYNGSYNLIAFVTCISLYLKRTRPQFSVNSLTINATDARLETLRTSGNANTVHVYTAVTGLACNQGVIQSSLGPVVAYSDLYVVLTVRQCQPRKYLLKLIEKYVSRWCSLLFHWIPVFFCSIWQAADRLWWPPIIRLRTKFTLSQERWIKCCVVYNSDIPPKLLQPVLPTV